MYKQKISLLAIMLFVAMGMQAQTIIGTWRTIDDKTLEAKSYITLYEEDGKIFGKVTKLLQKDPKTTICDLCPDDRKGQLVMGMVLLKNLKKSGSTWKGGKILDPNNGKIYSCKAWLDVSNSDKLHLRGYIGPFYRTQTWYRVE